MEWESSARFGIDARICCLVPLNAVERRNAVSAVGLMRGVAWYDGRLIIDRWIRGAWSPKKKNTYNECAWGEMHVF